MTRSSSSPLTGCRVLVTRAADQAADLTRALTDLGAEVVASPLVRSEAVAGAELPDLAAFDWLVVTSPNGVRFLRDRLLAAGTAGLQVPGEGGSLLPASLRLAVVGPGTAAAAREALGRTADLCPDVATGAQLAAACRQLGPAPGLRVLRVRGDLAPSEVEAALRSLGAGVEVCTLYRTRQVPPPAEVVALVEAGAVDAVTFASGSAVTSFEQGFPGHGLHAAAAAACLGPVTARAAAAAGWQRIITADEPSAAGLAAALARSLT